MAIETILTLRELFRLTYRSTEGFAKGVMKLMQMQVMIPDFTSLSKRAKKISVSLNASKIKGSVFLVVDSTGLKVHGEGEWKVRKHGYSKRRTWRKLHLAINEKTQEIEAEVLTDNAIDDAAVVDELLDQTNNRTKKFGGDGAYGNPQTFVNIRIASPKAVERNLVRRQIDVRTNQLVGSRPSHDPMVAHCLDVLLIRRTANENHLSARDRRIIQCPAFRNLPTSWRTFVTFPVFLPNGFDIQTALFLYAKKIFKLFSVPHTSLPSSVITFNRRLKAGFSRRNKHRRHAQTQATSYHLAQCVRPSSALAVKLSNWASSGRPNSIQCSIKVLLEANKQALRTVFSAVIRLIGQEPTSPP